MSDVRVRLLDACAQETGRRNVRANDMRSVETAAMSICWRAAIAMWLAGCGPGQPPTMAEWIERAASGGEVHLGEDELDRLAGALLVPEFGRSGLSFDPATARFDGKPVGALLQSLQ